LASVREELEASLKIQAECLDNIKKEEAEESAGKDCLLRGDQKPLLL
jgi:hypothetical protein